MLKWYNSGMNMAYFDHVQPGEVTLQSAKLILVAVILIAAKDAATRKQSMYFVTMNFVEKDKLDTLCENSVT